MPNRFLAAVLAVGLVAVAHGAAAQQKQEQKKEAAHDPQDAIRMCIGCHGIPGYKTAFPNVYHVPKIAGQQPAYIVNALKAYKSGERSHPSMRGIAASLTEEDMKKLAEYYGGPAK
jgi:cytochrome c553